MTYDLAIIGGGPAGAAAAVYAARKRLKTVFVTSDWLGQSNVSEKIENWIGTVAISGLDLSRSLEKHAKAYADGIIDFKESERCTKCSIADGGSSTSNGHFSIGTDKGTYLARTVLIASGSSRRKLDIPGAEKYDNKGLTYCATCDGPLFADQDVAVIGGGNAGFESAAQLLAYCKSVTLLIRGDQLKADPGTIERVTKNPQMHVIKFAMPKEVRGDKFVNAYVYTDTRSGKEVVLPVTGIFVEIGSLPNTDFAKVLVKLDASDHVIIDPRTQRTSIDGVWSAGDCTDGLYHQNNIAAGDAVKAIEDIYSWLHAR
ncbi:MAG: FAD-dependent oxidoreductase [Candidatus Taylorbacteria bacterium]